MLVCGLLRAGKSTLARALAVDRSAVRSAATSGWPSSASTCKTRGARPHGRALLGPRAAAARPRPERGLGVRLLAPLGPGRKAPRSPRSRGKSRASGRGLHLEERWQRIKACNAEVRGGAVPITRAQLEGGRGSSRLPYSASSPSTTASKRGLIPSERQGDPHGWRTDGTADVGASITRLVNVLLITNCYSDQYIDH